MKPKKESPSFLPPLIFPGKTSKERKYLAALKEQGLVRAIGPKIYTSVPEREVESLLKTSWGMIVANLFPNALVSHITALTYAPNKEGEIFLTTTSNRNIHFPGLTLRLMRGPGADIDDPIFMGIRASSFERALLENLASAKGQVSGRVLSQEMIEEKLEAFLLNKGESEFNQLRDRARTISERLDMKLEFTRLDKIMGAMLGTRLNGNLKSVQGVARAQGAPFDIHCFGRLEKLFAHLRHMPLKEIVDQNKSPIHFSNKAFFESYFSNYIEGTIFEVIEAERIVFDKKIPEARPIDAHDILSTFKIASDPNEMKITPKNPSELEELLKNRHARLFEKRLDIFPGEFKTKNNQAGSTVFVQPDYLKGTLQKGFELYESLPVGLARSIFMMFFISDIHPFNDGNGRISRIMMNAELYSKNLSTIIIPNVYREDYILSLRALSRRSDPDPYTRMLTTAHEFSCLDFSNYVEIKEILEKRNWFQEPSDAKLIR